MPEFLVDVIDITTYRVQANDAAAAENEVYWTRSSGRNMPGVSLVGYRRAYEVAPASATDRALAIIADLLDDDECQYDHHDLCQTHRLHVRPCPIERGRKLLGVAGG